MKTLKHLALCLAAAFIATGCSNDENEPKNGAMKEGKPVKFEMSISNTNTRTSTDAESRMTSWAKGDAVGIFVYDESGEAVYNNVKYEYNGTDWQATGASGGIMIEDGVTYKYYAYYPYNAESNSAANISLSAITEQNEGNNYDLSDILAARNTDEKTDAENGIVTLLFKHMFAMVEVSLYGDKVANQPTSVKLLNVQQEATMNLAGSTDVIVTPSGEATNIEMKYLGTKKNAHAYRAVVPAQTINASTPLVAVYGATDGKDYQFSYSVPVPYEQGRYRIMEVKIGEADSGITIPEKNMNIDPWTPASSVDGNGSYEEIKIVLIKEFTESNLTQVTDEPEMIEEGWYAFYSRKDQAGVFSVNSLADNKNSKWQKSLKLSFTSTWTPKITNSYYIAAITYNHITPINIESTNGIYKITFKAKGSITEGTPKSKCNIACISTKTERAFGINTAVGTITGENPKSTMAGIDLTEDWPENEYTVYINFAKVNWEAKSQTDPTLVSKYSGNSPLNVSSDSEDLSMINLRFYTTTNATETDTKTVSNLEITDVTMEPYNTEKVK